LDIATLLDKNGNPSSRRLTSSVVEELTQLTPWLTAEAPPAERLYQLHHGLKAPTGCRHCGKPVAFRSWKEGYLTFCSISCSIPYRPVRVKKPKPRLLTKEERLERQVKTNLERYGVPWAWMSQSGKESKKKIMAQRMAAEWSSELVEKGYTPLFSHADYTGNRDQLDIQCNKCETRFKVQRLRWVENHNCCPTCYTPRASKGQHEVADFIRSIGVSVRVNDRKEFKGKMELDIFVPEKNLVVEYDGLFWHSERGRADIKEKSWYKFEQLKERGYRYLMFFDDEWENKNEVVKSRIRNALGVIDTKLPARRCDVVSLTGREQRDFFAVNHTQGAVVAAEALGLVSDGQLVAAMSFGSSRFSGLYDWELLRFATKVNTSVVGGASRLFSHWRRSHQGQSIVSFSDNRWGTGGFYQKLGFTEDGQTGQGYFYTNSNGTRRSRQQHMKHKLKDVLPKFDPNLTERENCWSNGWYRVWDLGNTRWVLPRT
jgi:very-short-patch-repair endonuclease